MPRKTRPLVIVTRKLPEAVEARLRKRFGARLNETDKPFGPRALKAAMAEADILVPTISDRIGADVLKAAGPRLKLLANFGAGLDHIDLAAAKARGMTVTNTPGALTDATADIALMLILGVARRLIDGVRAIDKDRFKGWHPTWMMGRSLGGMKLGIVGLGRIGRAVAVRAKAFGMEIHYHNRTRADAEIEARLGAIYWPDLDAVLPEMDMVSLNCPRTPETFHLMSARRLKRMKRGSFLINTARGDVVDEAALAAILKAGHLAGAGLDVFEREPIIHPGLKNLANVLLLPHMGSGTIETRTAMGEKVIANIEAFLAGKTPPDTVK